MRRRALWLVVAVAWAACRSDADRGQDLPDTIAPIGTGTELLLTRERFEVIDDWIRASVARDGKAPASLDEVRPPEADAGQYVPLDRFLRDGWGRAIEYHYSPDTATYELRSPGEDGVVGTADDLTRRGHG
jgi:type II secretion system (T2SS) protein G